MSARLPLTPSASILSRITYNTPAIPLHLLASSPSRIQTRLFSSGTRLTKPKAVPDPTTPIPPKLTHLTSTGAAHMVPVTHKTPTHRTATAAQSLIFSSPDTYAALLSATLRKGDAIAVARVAGIQAAKRTAELIPLAHPGLGIESVVVDIAPFAGVRVRDENRNVEQREEPTTKDSLSIEQLSVPAQIRQKAEHGGVYISATVACTAKTGVEMEALTAASVAGLTMYDMLKGVDKGMKLGEGRVVAKKGGTSGGWRWNWERQRVVRDEDGEE